jgi:hypothetical protein
MPPDRPTSERITLTPTQLVEVCVQFAADMGWIDAPIGKEWLVELKHRAGPQLIRTTSSRKRRLWPKSRFWPAHSVAMAAQDSLDAAGIEYAIDVESLGELQRRWEAP